MKRFIEKSKYLGLVVLAMGLVFAGCAGDPSSSSDDAVSPSGMYVGSVPAVMDVATNQLTIGDGSGPQDILYNGHPVRLTNPPCTLVAQGVQCDIKVTNLDTANYMTNVSIMLNNCLTCTTANIQNADLEDGAPLVTPAVGNPGAPSSKLNGSEITYVENGRFLGGSYPFNDNGAPTHPILAIGKAKPVQIIHPECGSETVPWIFGNQTVNYRFRINFSADYLPWDTRLDPTYDFFNYTTFWAQVTDLNDKIASAPGRSWYRLGSYQRSNVLSGGGVGGGASLAPLQYFGVNTSVEYADRIEQRIVGNPASSTNYEFYYNYAWLLVYDPAVVQPVAANGKTPAGTGVVAGELQTCSSLANCGFGKNTYDEAFVNMYSTSNASQGWIATAFGMSGNHPWQWLSANFTYQTFNGGAVFLTSWAYSLVPLRMGHAGIAHIDPALASITWGMNADSFMVQEGADTANDYPLRMYYFRAIGPSGSGSEFWFDTISYYTSTFLGWTNGGMDPASDGYVPGSTNWFGYCWPMVQPAVYPGQGCTGGDPSTLVIQGGFEQSNYGAYNLRATGESVPLYGVYQQWPAHICIQ